jgi:hypothetical protein
VRRKKSVPLDLTVKVATALPMPHRLGFPCIACGGEVDLAQAYCPACRQTAAGLEALNEQFRPIRERMRLREACAA